MHLLPVVVALAFPGPTACQAAETVRLSDPAAIAWDQLGKGVAILGDDRIAGGVFRHDGAAPGAGGVMVFRRDGGAWSIEDLLFAPGAANDDQLGYDVAGEGDWIVAGGPESDVGCSPAGDCDLGRAEVFHFVKGAWTHHQSLVPPGLAEGDRLGVHVAMQGDLLAVGATGADAPGESGVPDAGVVHLFRRLGATWTYEDTLAAPDAQSGASFGRWFDIDGDRIAIGAPAWVPEGAVLGQAIGRAYVFRRVAGTWTHEQTIPTVASGTNAFFGTAVSLDGDALLIGAWGDDAIDLGAGAAFVFRRVGVVWSLEASLRASDGDSLDNFGNGCALEGDVAVVSAWGDEMPAGSGSGSAYVFVRDGADWVEAARLVQSSAAGFDELGRPVVLRNGRVVLGSIGFDAGGVNQAGAMPVYEGVGLDCNGNGTIDLCDIATGASIDANGDGVPDECATCAADLDASGNVDFTDLLAVLAAWGPCPACPEDLDDSGAVDFADLLAVLAAWGEC